MSKIGTIHSMTGFGLGRAEEDGLTVQVEIRSVNHRGMKLNVRSRPSLGPLEKKLRDGVRKQLKRGSVDVFVTVTRPLDTSRPPIRQDVAEAAVAGLRHLAATLNLGGELSISDLTQIPGLFDAGAEAALSDEEWPTIATALQGALQQVAGMRAEEGNATAECLLEIVAPIERFAKNARAIAPQVVERLQTRLTGRIETLRETGLDTGDKQAIEREVCMYADRVDINEEMDRLDSHVAQFRSNIANGGEIGKRMEFLSQEFLREINTTASKANDTEITSRAVEAKLAVEKIKEQAANLE